MMGERVRRFGLAVIVAAVVVLVDQATKLLAISELSEDRRIPLLGDVLGLQLAFNPGAIFSFGASVTGLITLIGVGATVWLVVAAALTRNAWAATGFGFILGGAVGNLIDRLFSPPGFGIGHVTDFLAYGNLFIGNLADVALGIGACLLVIAGLRASRPRRAEPDTIATEHTSHEETVS
ncbi:signal peptidase [Microbacterium sp. CH12i]|uniref:signal peptidase II n=1 Tax=Microbacterium sp. CH12i TaxID=1479651 RepID=UPI000460A949|nr:signal peptidase II [Microbacterium sp. CH12i]KDA04547.1 signal peptidase [Microbacterium sp. CH12i]